MAAVNVPLIELTNAGVEFNGVRTTSGITFNVTRGEFVCLHGSTGSGKSLALKLIAGLVTPTSGEVRVAGELINGFSGRQKLWLRRSMGLMLQEAALLGDRSILENVMLPAIAGEESWAESRTRAMSALDKCGIAGLAKLYPSELSAGQRQLARLARAVVNHPVVILADEPASNLDVDNAQGLMDLLGEFSRAGAAVIVASHLQITPITVPCRAIRLGGPES